MNKKLNLFLLAVLLLTAGLILGACKGDASLVSISVVSGSIQTDYVVGEEPDFSNIVVRAKFSNNDRVNIGFNNVTISEIDNTVLGPQTVTVTYKGKTATFTINFYVDIQESYNIVGFQKPAFVVAYESNIAVKSDKQTEFINRTDGYYVGDDNPFVFLPNISALDNNDLPVNLNRYRSINVVQVKDNGNWVELTEDLEDYVVIDDLNSSFDFTELAIGKEFRITVRPEALILEELNAMSNGPISFEFKVINGWNAYSAKDLSRIDNASIAYDGVANPWAEYKDANNVGNEDIRAIIMHNNIAITRQDLPAIYFWSQAEVTDLGLPSNLVGTRKDWVAMYVRGDEVGEHFDFIGNYFTVDASGLARTMRSKNGNLITANGGQLLHTTLFSFGGDDHNVPENAQGGDILAGSVTVKNVALLGNGNRSNDYIMSGAISFFRTTSENFTLQNTISRQVLTLHVAVGIWENNVELTSNNVIDSRGYDSYSNMFYIFGAQINVQNSVFKNAGGPVFVVSHYNVSDGVTANYGRVTTINSTIETFVAGTEAWFQLLGVTGPIVTQIQGLTGAIDQLLTALGRTERLKNAGVSSFNLVGVLLGEDMTDSLNYPTANKANLEIGTNGNATGADMQNPVYPTFKSMSAPLIQFASGTYIFFDGQNFLTTSQQPFANPAAIGGEYLYVYFNGMCLMFKYVA